ncbi:MAG: hypothetical protein KDD50_00035, partial [Bdellovibrionales bacterium]|nr:hypothetical protein [Bdellovibrionales bacterium]
MKNEVQKIYHLIENEISQMDPTKYHNNDAKTLLAEGDWIENLIQLSNFSLNALEISRIKAEFIGLGPIEHLLLDTEITEILILHEKDIWFEKNGSLLKHSDSFLGHLSFQNFVKKISHLIGQQYSLKTPYVNGRFENCRVHLIGP